MQTRDIHEHSRLVERNELDISILVLLARLMEVSKSLDDVSIVRYYISILEFYLTTYQISRYLRKTWKTALSLRSVCSIHMSFYTDMNFSHSMHQKRAKSTSESYTCLVSWKILSALHVMHVINRDFVLGLESWSSISLLYFRFQLNAANSSKNSYKLDLLVCTPIPFPILRLKKAS